MNAPTSLSGRAFSVLRRRLPSLLAASIWPYVALVALIVITSVVYHRAHPGGVTYDPVTLWHSMFFRAQLGVILGFVASTSIPYGLAFAGVSLLVYDDCRGIEGTLGDALSRVMRRLLPVMVLSFLVGCGGVCGSFIFFVPGLLVAILTAFAVPVLLLEEAGIGNALRRSMSLASSRSGTILGLMLALAVVWFSVVIIFFLLIPAANLDVSSMEAAWAFRVLLATVLPILICVYCTMLTILYYDIRVSRGELQATVQLSA